MHIVITRQSSTLSGTPGLLYAVNAAGASYACATLELPWRDNASGVSCIEADTYRATPWHSEHLGCDVLRLEDKHGRADCLIHCGNFAGDQAHGLQTQVHGCTLVGARFDSLRNDSGQWQLAIIDSRLTLAKLVAFAGPGEHVVEYRWAPGCAPADAPSAAPASREAPTA